MIKLNTRDGYQHNENPMKPETIKSRHQRSYSPDGLMVFRGPDEDYGPGSHWIVGDEFGYAEIMWMDDSKAYQPNTMYIENIVIKEPKRGQGHGRTLYAKIEDFARNLGVNYIQIDSEAEALGFWEKMNYKKIDAVYYQNKTAMIKQVKTTS
jgi:ribosomal protein S18 acetylase RimI-like enzyme